MATIVVDHSRVEVLEGFDETFDELFESVTAGVPCAGEAAGTSQSFTLWFWMSAMASLRMGNIQAGQRLWVCALDGGG